MGYFLLYVFIFLLPILTQFTDYGRDFKSIFFVFETSHQLSVVCLLASILVVCLGLFALDGWRAAGWSALILILALASFRADVARQTWTHWNTARDYTIALTYLLQVAVMGVIPVMVWLFRKQFPVVEWAKCSLSIVAIIQTAVTMLQFTNPGESSWLYDWGIASASSYGPRDSTGVHSNAIRLSGLTSSPTVLGMVLTLAWPTLLITKLRTVGDSFYRRLHVIARACLLILAIWAIVLTYTRAAYIGLALQCFVLTYYALCSKSKNRLCALVNLFIVAVATVMAINYIPSADARLTAIGDGADASITNRLKIFTVAGTLIFDRPLSGWGPGFFNFLYNKYYKVESINYDFFDVHSAILNTFLEIGIIGVVLGYFTIVGFTWRVFFRKVPVWGWLGCVGVTVPIFVDNPTSNPSFMFPAVWVLGTLMVTGVAAETLSLRLTRDIGYIEQKVQKRNVIIVTLLAMGWLIGYSIPMEFP